MISVHESIHVIVLSEPTIRDYMMVSTHSTIHVIVLSETLTISEYALSDFDKKSKRKIRFQFMCFKEVS